MTASKPEVKVHDKLYVNGKWAEPAGKGMLDVINSTTEEVMGRVPEGAAEDVNVAVAAARARFEAWSSTPVEERAGFLKRVSERLAARQNEIAAIIASE
ncbi:MAG TPA: aldehyde dehydrogenase family protein, partial [Blastocatellia bacterium]|nr:aldehyde dehydrogenase family protein [Blastocatellia bacterium]